MVLMCFVCRAIGEELMDKQSQLDKLKRGESRGDAPRDRDRGDDRRGGGGRDADTRGGSSSREVADLEEAVERLTRQQARAKEDIEGARDLTARREARTKLR